MEESNFETLRVYKTAERLSDAVWRIVSKWSGLAKDTVGPQLVRAADSIGANIAEGNGRYHYRENRRFVRIARGSLYETKYWLHRAHKRGLLTRDQFMELMPLADQLAPSLNAYLKSLSKKLGEEQQPAAGVDQPAAD